jgi:hypothetical protein
LTHVEFPSFAREPTDAGRVAAWVCDRDAQVVEGLDADLYRAVRVPVSYPLAVAARPDGGAWVVSASLPNPGVAQSLVCLRSDGGLEATAAVGVVRDLAATARGEALVVDALGGVARIALFGREGRLIAERRVPAASCVAARAGRVLVGTSDGQLVSTDVDLSVLRRRALDAAILDVEPAGNGWFVLEDAALGRLLRLDDDLSTDWGVALERRSARIGALPRGSAVWTVGSGARLFGEGGAVVTETGEFPMRGARGGVAWRNGGLLTAAPGAIMHLDQHGRVAPGQGGFDFLVDLSAVPGLGAL